MLISPCILPISIMGIHFDPRGETVTIHRRTFLALTAATSIDTSAIRGCVGAINRLARDVPLGTEARQSLNDYASIQTSIGTEAPDILGQLLGLNEVVLTGSQDTSTHQGRFQIVTLTLRYAIDDNHTWTETIPVILALQGSHIQNIIIPSADDIGTLPEPLRQAILAPQKDIHRGELPDPAPSTAELYEMEARTNPELSERSAGKSGRFKAAAYANKYWSHYNGAYRRFDGSGRGGDCTNFVSQCMEASGWGYTGNLVWKNTDRSWFYLKWPQYTSASWVNVGKFRSFALANKRTRLASHYYDMWHGNVVQYGYNSACYHSMIVTGRSGKQPLLTYHSTNTHNIPFFALQKRVNSAGKRSTWDGQHGHFT
ncbi:amidase domain-containing protein [Cutibacterium sp. V970]|uniref:amidase domain-containing protein n=1 Tax=Cutibacterium sp. V970 TaxID=3446481 RepID=UPI003EE1320B